MATPGSRTQPNWHPPSNKLRGPGQRACKIQGGVARIAPGERFASAPITIDVPAAAPENVKLVLAIDRYHYRLGQATHVSIAGSGAKRDLSLVDTPYYAELTDIAPQAVFGIEPITIRGRALARDGGEPMAHVPVKLVFRVRGFERQSTLYTDGEGVFAYAYVPAANETGLYRVSVTHPDIVDRPEHGSFIVVGASVRPTAFNIHVSRNLDQRLSVSVASGHETTLDNVRLAYEAEDQAGGALAQGIAMDTGAPFTIGANRTGYLNPVFTAADAGSLRLRVLADNLSDPLGVVTVHYTLSEAIPSLLATPSFLETGVGVVVGVSAGVAVISPGLQIDALSVRRTSRRENSNFETGTDRTNSLRASATRVSDRRSRFVYSTGIGIRGRHPTIRFGFSVDEGTS